MRRRRAIVSVHDVRPQELDEVYEIVELLRSEEVDAITLLVVPGLNWTSAELERLRRLVSEGCGVAGHGWSHDAPPVGTLYHRVHAALISRDQAEHLSRPTGELCRRVTRCHAWFASVGLPVPELYVPPAWALGRLGRAELAGLPFRWYEVLAGVAAGDSGRLTVMPLVGFEADTTARALALEVSNRMNLGLTQIVRKPLRIAIHPQDLKLRLARRVRELVSSEWIFTTVEDTMRNGGLTVAV